jgi:MFS family permease
VPTYSVVLNKPGVVRVIGSQLLARFAFGMMSLGFVFHIQNAYHSYALAGIALGFETVGAAVAGPILSRNIGRIGVRRLIWGTSILTSMFLLVIGLVPVNPAFLCLVALGVGVSSPPIQAAVRAIYPTLVSRKERQALFSLDATLQELIWIIGPVLATFVAATISPMAVIILMVCVQLLGSALFLANPEVGSGEFPKSSGRLGGVLKKPIVLWLMAIGTLLIGSFSGVEVGTVGALSRGTAGVVISVFSIGSILGGFIIGPRAKNAKALVWFTSLILVGYVMANLMPTNPWWLGLCWFISGLGIAPALGLISHSLSLVLSPAESAEAFGWIMTGQLMGYSAGAALAGIAIDTIGNTSAIWLATIFEVFTVLACILALPYMPSLHHVPTQGIQIVETHDPE